MSTVLENPTLEIPTLPGCVMEVYESMDGWLRGRDFVIGASESASILGVGYAEESPIRVWARKRGEEDGMADTEGLECGRVLQPAILELFSRRTGLKVDNLGEFTLCRSITHPWLGASLDGVIVETPDGPAVAEAKNVSVFMGREWDDDEQPLKFQIQVQHQMVVAGVNIAYTIGLIGGNKLRYVKSVRNQKFIDAMVPKLAEFMELVEKGEEPSGKWIDGSEGTKKTLLRLHPDDNGETAVLSLESAEWHKTLEDAKGKVKHWQSEADRLCNLFRQSIGDNTFGLMPDGSRYSLKTQDKQLYCCDNCGHTKRSNTFRVLRHSKK